MKEIIKLLGDYRPLTTIRPDAENIVVAMGWCEALGNHGYLVARGEKVA